MRPLTAGSGSSANNSSQNLNLLEIAATKFIATTSGAAITGAVDGAINDALANGGNPITAGPNGVTFNFAAEPQPNARTQEAFDALSYAATGYTKAPPPQPLFDRVRSAWADVRGTGFDQHDAFGEHGSQLNVTAGVGRKLTPDFLVGLFGGYENGAVGGASDACSDRKPDLRPAEPAFRDGCGGKAGHVRPYNHSGIQA